MLITTVWSPSLSWRSSWRTCRGWWPWARITSLWTSWWRAAGERWTVTGTTASAWTSSSPASWGTTSSANCSPSECSICLREANDPTWFKFIRFIYKSFKFVGKIFSLESDFGPAILLNLEKQIKILNQHYEFTLNFSNYSHFSDVLEVRGQIFRLKLAWADSCVTCCR